jgi:hypothetical protein
MKIKIDIDTSNAAFADENGGAEAARILRDLADRLEGSGVLARSDTKFLRDVNGNTVGTYKTTAR